jgi:hypothetical protein
VLARIGNGQLDLLSGAGDPQGLAFPRQAGRRCDLARSGHHDSWDRLDAGEVRERGQLVGAGQERAATQPPLAQLDVSAAHATTT